MFKVGLTGGIASGKSTISHLFTELGVTVIDADKIARDLVEPDQPCYHEILLRFGSEIVLDNCHLDRQKLRQIIFDDQQAKSDLENILHPNIRQQLISQSDAAATSSYCILSVPLLIEANMTSLVDRILIIDTTPELQLSRLCARDNITQDVALKMINSQIGQQQRLQAADDIIINTGSASMLNKQVMDLHKTYCNLAKLSATSCQHVDSHGQ